MISGRKVHMPLGSLANRQGRIIGTNVMGGADRFRGTVGTFCLKVFESWRCPGRLNFQSGGRRL